jgi:DNA ligase (NAD+)
LKSFENSKSRPFPHVLFSLGIRHVGEGIAELLASGLRSVQAIEMATEEEISAIEGIGPEIAQSVRSYFDTEENKALLWKLKAAGLKFEMEGSAAAVEGPFSGKTFVITGTLSTMSRKDATEFIENRGGKVVSSISGKTSFLLVGSDAGSKVEKARELGITQLTEEQLKQLASD